MIKSLLLGLALVSIAIPALAADRLTEEGIRSFLTETTAMTNPANGKDEGAIWKRIWPKKAFSTA